MTQTATSFNPETTALVITDPQNDFLSPDGVDLGCRRGERGRERHR